MTKNAKDFLTGFLKSNLIIIGVIIVIALTPFQDLLESDYIILIFNFSVLFISFHNFFDKEDKIEIEGLGLSIIGLPLSAYLTLGIAPIFGIYMREETSGELITFFIVSYFIAIASFSTLIQNNNDLFLDKKIRNNKKKLSLQQSIINESVHKASGHGKNLEGIHVQNNTTDIEHSKTQKIGSQNTLYLEKDIITILILANSKKYNNRCIAGILVKIIEDGGKNLYIEDSRSPVWVRVIQDKENGAINNELVKDINIGTIISFYGKKMSNCNPPYQKENYLLIKNEINIVKNVKFNLGNIVTFLKENNFLLPSESIYVEDSVNISKSLQLIRIEEGARVYNRVTKKGKIQYRISFIFKKHEYDLPITDTHYIEKLEKNTEKGQIEYLIISLGIPYESKIYALVAGVLLKN